MHTHTHKWCFCSACRTWAPAPVSRCTHPPPHPPNPTIVWPPARSGSPMHGATHSRKSTHKLSQHSKYVYHHSWYMWNSFLRASRHASCEQADKHAHPGTYTCQLRGVYAQPDQTRFRCWWMMKRPIVVNSCCMIILVAWWYQPSPPIRHRDDDRWQERAGRFHESCSGSTKSRTPFFLIHFFFWIGLLTVQTHTRTQTHTQTHTCIPMKKKRKKNKKKKTPHMHANSKSLRKKKKKK